MASIAASSVSMQPRHSLATTRASGLKLASFVNQERNNLSFRLRPVPARLRISCAAKPETVDKVCEIARKQLALSSDEPVTGASKFSDLGADSLDTQTRQHAGHEDQVVQELLERAELFLFCSSSNLKLM
ncbi:acyl carrier protein 2, chloroplastic isoform X2 [Gossypium hirsutum]|uniref:Acyl carrier protein 2, chloroplastic isoform X2 n=1 Tax=Gossypium hirsutum TaxID=3635 RepID=A0A1U8MF95_GOSHI|nr:acyl carrier protein 2, chloroplastic-like isoform X2 [Gossypium hirsutum]